MGCPWSKSDAYSDTTTTNHSPHLTADRKLKELLVQKGLVCPDVLKQTGGDGKWNCNNNSNNKSSRYSSSTNGDTMFNRLSRRIKPRHFDSRVLDSYDVKTLIGKGSFSRVIRAEHRATRQQVAIKMVPAKNGCGPFENELCILSQVRHPNVTRLIEVFRSPNRVYMVMELATGGELYDRIVTKGSYNERDTALTLRMILDGVAYLHRTGITHRDLKPENLLYYCPSPDSKILITDFGLAHQRKRLEDGLMMDPCGTPEYIAPEVLARIPYTSKVDLWAIGVITYILLSGTMPFDDENRTIMYRHILRGRYHFHYEVRRYSSSFFTSYSSCIRNPITGRKCREFRMTTFETCYTFVIHSIHPCLLVENLHALLPIVYYRIIILLLVLYTQIFFY